MSRHYGVFPGDRGTHFLSGDAELEVVSTDAWDNNRATYRFYGGPRNGQMFSATAEHFKHLPKNENCPTCGEKVYSIFDHLDEECG